MKKSFREYYAFTDAEINRLWKDAVVILDTNVLLDFYCFGKETLDDYYAVLDKIKQQGQLWMPYQVGYELHNRRIGIINRQINQYDNILKYLAGTQQQISDLTNSSPSHAHLDFDDIARKYQEAVKPIKSEVEKLKKAHPDHLGDDKILKKLEGIFDDDIVGQQFSDKDLEDIYKEGENRYSKKIPPGYKDQDKKDDEKEPPRNRKYGDLLIWKQIINKAKEAKKPIIFVTNDAKEDWILKAKDGRKFGARPQLKKEMLTEADVDFMLYSSDEFLDVAHKQLKLNVNAKSVNEVKKYREREMERMRNMRIHYFPSKGYPYMISPKRWEELHHYIHVARDLTRNSLKHADRATLSHRAERDLMRLQDAYEEIHMLIDRSPDAFIEVGFRIRDMLGRCYDLLDDVDRLDIPDFNELYHLTRKMLLLVERRPGA